MELVSDDKLAHFGNFIFQDELLKHSIDYYTSTSTSLSLSLSLPSGGSFRQFLWQVVRELQSSVLPLLMPCPSSASGLNHGKYILAPGPMTYSEEKLLHFFGQVRQRS